MNIIKRDGSEVEFRKEKITSAVSKAFDATSEVQKKDIPVQAEITTSIVMSKLRKKTPDVETVQDLVEDALTDLRFKKLLRRTSCTEQNMQKKEQEKKVSTTVCRGNSMK